MKLAICLVWYALSAYGPEPMTLSSGWSLSAGNTLESTIAPAPVPRIWFHSELPSFSVITTVVGSGVVVATSPSRLDGPFGSAILMTLSKENLTSALVSGSPLENFRPGLSLQVHTLKSGEDVQPLAASGTGFCVFSSTRRRVW